MLSIVLYDISSNKKRRYLIKILKKAGYVRIQKSVFADKYNSKQKEKAVKAIQKLHKKMSDESDKVIFTEIATEQTKNITQIGETINFRQILFPKKTIIF